MTIEVTNMRKYSGKSNKLRFTYNIGGTPRNIAIKERAINIKIKIIPFIIRGSFGKYVAWSCFSVTD